MENRLASMQPSMIVSMLGKDNDKDKQLFHKHYLHPGTGAIQIVAPAMITYLLVAIVKHQLKLKQTQYEILQILSISLLCKTPLPELFSNSYPQYIGSPR